MEVAGADDYGRAARRVRKREITNQFPAAMMGSSAGRTFSAAASFAARGTGTLSVPREARHTGLRRVLIQREWRCLQSLRLAGPLANRRLI